MILGGAIKAFLQANRLPLLCGVAALVGVSLIYFGAVHKGRVVQAEKDQPKVTAGAISQAVTPVTNKLNRAISEGAGKVAASEGSRQEVLNAARKKVAVAAATVPQPVEPLVAGVEDGRWDAGALAYIDGLVRLRSPAVVP